MSRINCIGWSLTMILRYGETNGEGFPEIRRDGTVDVRELLAYEVVSSYYTTVEDLEEVIKESVEVEEDGTLKYRFEGVHDDGGNLTDVRICQGHSTFVQRYLTESLYMKKAFWGDDLMTKYLLHGTKRKHV